MAVITQQKEIVVPPQIAVPPRTVTPPQGMFYKRIHEATLAIDNELITAEDAQYREMLVKAAYTLMNLEERIQRSGLCSRST